MASSKEAFAKFGTWKKFRTVLRVTVLEKGKLPDIFSGEVAVANEESGEVSFAVHATRSYRVVDLSDASFVVGNRALEATRSVEDRLVCEEKP